ncbi:MAG: prepilin peptidase [Solobacterium sp.]|nr:prepilin peptidase [Solobacterium sp.]
MILYFFLGSSLSSYFVCLIYRKMHPSFVEQRSTCERCRRPLHGYELIPILGFFINRGKCPICGYQIPIYYLFLECFGGFLGILYYLIK